MELELLVDIVLVDLVVTHPQILLLLQALHISLLLELVKEVECLVVILVHQVMALVLPDMVVVILECLRLALHMVTQL